MAVKLDMSKAYDRVEWPFLAKVMEKMGFEARWTELIIRCVSSVSHVVVINGEPSDFFMPDRGLRQGDPISTHLFIICADVFSHLIQMEVNRGSLQGIWVCRRAPEVSHLLFADDDILFSREDDRDAQAIRRVLEFYSGASGQQINFSKSEVVISANVQQSSALLEVKLVEVQGKYLAFQREWGDPKHGL